MYARLIGTGSYLPGKPLATTIWRLGASTPTTNGLSRGPEFVVAILLNLVRRRTNWVGCCAARLEMAGVTAEDIDLIIVAIVDPDFIFPSTACLIQGRLGNKGGSLRYSGCLQCGFTYALGIAENSSRSGSHKRRWSLVLRCFPAFLTGTTVDLRFVRRRCWRCGAGGLENPASWLLPCTRMAASSVS